MDDLISRQVTIAQPKNTCENTCEVARTTNDCISRNAAIDVMFNFHECYGRRYAEIDLEEFNALPSAQREGKWIKEYEEWFTDYPYKCTNCGKYSRARYHFCPNCGADMMEETGGAK